MKFKLIDLVKIGFVNFLGSYTIIFLFYLMGSTHIISILRGSSNLFLDILGISLCIYNTLWLTKVLDIKKAIKKNTFEILKNYKNTKAGWKKFFADVIFYAYWREIYTYPFKDDETRDLYIIKIINTSVDKFNSGDKI